ncbi:MULTISPECIES: phosphotransferase [unclassified Streptomyces]|uniref:phosphotransferase n=1 Tax=unclassified Streptomyces TaxID=2593676 RepID=UPI002E1D5A27|nr:aminoglycoside phosphotransferase family protein [Streptomyces sp. NBC_01023]
MHQPLCRSGCPEGHQLPLEHLSAASGQWSTANPANKREREILCLIGEPARRIRQAAPPRTAPADSGPPVDKTERHPSDARSHLAPGYEQFVRERVRRAEFLPALDWVETHGDFQLRNILRDGADDGSVALIGCEGSEPGPAVRDPVRLSDAWAGRPDLYQEFLAGYGRHLTNAEEDRACSSTRPSTRRVGLPSASPTMIRAR